MNDEEEHAVAVHNNSFDESHTAAAAEIHFGSAAQ